jgi:DNA modification methylase
VTVRILIGDVREQLRLLPADSFDCVVTSPPYWGLRDYGVAGQIGLERSLGEHLEVMVDVFNEVRRVMKPTATLWLNYGDCYATSPNGRSAADTKAAGNDDRTFRDKPFSTVGGVLKPKDLCMVPSRVAIALQEAGWWVRSHIIWHKPNPMPESVRDRPTNSHESIFLLAKSERYYFDADSVREKSERPDWMFETPTNPGNADRNDGGCTQRKTDKQRGHGRRHAGFNDRWDAMSKEEQQSNGRNIRNVWTVATHAYAEAHFATFPPDLIEPCIKAGCPKDGHVLDPFGGAGTTGLVADRLQRHATLIELNPEYAAIAERRIRGDAPLFAQALA